MNKKMMIKIATAIAIIAVVIPPIYLGGKWIEGLITVIAALAGYEVASLTHGGQDWPMTILNFIAIMCIGHVADPTLSLALAVWLAVLFVIELVVEKVNSDFVAYTFLMTTLMVLACRCVLHFYETEGGMVLMIYVCLATFLTDTGAYFFGVFLGKHKMIPRVSPNKTWEGAIGGYFCGLIGSLLQGYFFVKHVDFSLLIAGSLLMPIVSQIGDLAFSSIKRRFGIKDFGNAFPGHGGIYDRIDSLIFTLMMFNGLMIFWGF